MNDKMNSTNQMKIMKTMHFLMLVCGMLMAGCSSTDDTGLITDPTGGNPYVPMQVNIATDSEDPLEMTVGETRDLAVTFSTPEMTVNPVWGYTVSDETPVIVKRSGDNTLSLTARNAGETTITFFCRVAGRDFNKNLNVSVMKGNSASDGIIRVLAIGNSFSQDAVEQYLYELGEVGGKEMIIGNMYIGGCDLDKHLNNIRNDAAAYAYRKVVGGKKTETSSMKISSALADERWDYVSLQQVSGKSGIYSTYGALGEIIDYVTANAPEAKIIWHSTWAYQNGSTHADFPNYDRDQMTMYEAIQSATRQVLNDYPQLKLLVPSGTAIQNARNTYLGDTFNRDGYHLETTYGRYTAACTWYEAIFGMDVRNNGYKPSTVDEDKAVIARAAAHAAVANPFMVDPMSDYQPQISNEDLKAPVYIDFGSGAAAASPWNAVMSYKEGTANEALRDVEGDFVKATVEVLGGFTADYAGVGGESGHSDIVADGISFPIDAWKDAIIVSGTKGKGNVGPAKVVVKGLNPEKKYRFTMLGVRYNGSRAARITEYTLVGATKSDAMSVNTGLKIGSGAFASFGEVPFEEYLAKVDNFAPAADGSVTVEVMGIDTGSAAEGHLSALVITPL